MRKEDFINDMVGIQYINRGYSMTGCDCWGLVYLYFKNVLKLVPSLTEEYLTGVDFTEAFQAQLDLGQWIKIDRPTGDEVVFMMYSNEVPMHCGVMIDRINCLHSFGDPETSRGQVTLWSIEQVKRHLRRIVNVEPRVEFYKWQS